MGCGGSKKQNVKDTHQVSPNKLKQSEENNEEVKEEVPKKEEKVTPVVVIEEKPDMELYIQILNNPTHLLKLPVFSKDPIVRQISQYLGSKYEIPEEEIYMTYKTENDKSKIIIKHKTSGKYPIVFINTKSQIHQDLDKKENDLFTKVLGKGGNISDITEFDIKEYIEHSLNKNKFIEKIKDQTITKLLLDSPEYFQEFMCLEKAALEIYKTFVKKAKSLAKYVTESGMKPNLAFGYFNHYKYYYSYGGIILIPSSVLILEGQELTSKTKNHKILSQERKILENLPPTPNNIIRPLMCNITTNGIYFLAFTLLETNTDSLIHGSSTNGWQISTTEENKDQLTKLENNLNLTESYTLIEQSTRANIDNIKLPYTLQIHKIMEGEEDIYCIYNLLDLGLLDITNKDIVIEKSKMLLNHSNIIKINKRSVICCMECHLEIKGQYYSANSPKLHKIYICCRTCYSELLPIDNFQVNSRLLKLKTCQDSEVKGGCKSMLNLFPNVFSEYISSEDARKCQKGKDAIFEYTKILRNEIIPDFIGILKTGVVYPENVTDLEIILHAFGINYRYFHELKEQTEDPSLRKLCYIGNVRRKAKNSILKRLSKFSTKEEKLESIKKLIRMQVEKYIYKAEEEQINISQILVLYSISELFGFSIILKENLEKSTDNQQIANYELVQNGFGRERPERFHSKFYEGIEFEMLNKIYNNETIPIEYFNKGSEFIQNIYGTNNWNYIHFCLRYCKYLESTDKTEEIQELLNPILINIKQILADNKAQFSLEMGECLYLLGSLKGETDISGNFYSESYTIYQILLEDHPNVIKMKGKKNKQ